MTSEELSEWILLVANRTCPCHEAHDLLHERAGATAVEHLAEAGIEAEGIVGDSNPIVAIVDVLAEFAADEIVISAWPPGDSNWLEKNLIEHAREDFGIPVHHVMSQYGLDAAGARAA